LREFAQLYEAVKSERNRCASLIQTSTQKASEVREKLNIFDNECEILRSSVAHKEKYGVSGCSRSSTLVKFLDGGIIKAIATSKIHELRQTDSIFKPEPVLNGNMASDTKVHNLQHEN